MAPTNSASSSAGSSTDSNNNSTQIDMTSTSTTSSTNTTTNGSSDSANSVPQPPQSNRSQRSRHQPNRDFNSLDTNSTDYLYFDANTFKQVKRLYCGMLMVAMAYSVTMIIMMVVLYKTLPQSMSALQGGSSAFMGAPMANAAPASLSTNSPKMSFRTFGMASPSSDADHALEMLANPSLLAGSDSGSNNDAQQQQRVPSPAAQTSGSVATGSTTTTGLRSHDGRMVSHETARTYLDQVIAINFLTLILYSLAFYAAHRELYTLTLAFTSTLSFTMMFSVVKIFVEGVHFPNNFMSLLLRVSIVFVALVYLGQLRRKQHFVRNMWLSPSSLLNHPALRSSQMTPTQTAQLIRQFLANQAGVGGVAHSSSSAYKTEDELMNEYQDQPPNYEDALRCPVPNEFSSPRSGASGLQPPPPGSVIPLQTITPSGSNLASRASQVTLGPPPSFEELHASRTSLNSVGVSISVPETSHSSSTTTTSTSSAESTVINVGK